MQDVHSEGDPLTQVLQGKLHSFCNVRDELMLSMIQ